MSRGTPEVDETLTVDAPDGRRFTVRVLTVADSPAGPVVTGMIRRPRGERGNVLTVTVAKAGYTGGSDRVSDPTREEETVSRIEYVPRRQVDATITEAEGAIDVLESEGPREHLLRELVAHARGHMDGSQGRLVPTCPDLDDLVKRYPGDEDQ